MGELFAIIIARVIVSAYAGVYFFNFVIHLLKLEAIVPLTWVITVIGLPSINILVNK